MSVCFASYFISFESFANCECEQSAQVLEVEMVPLRGDSRQHQPDVEHVTKM